MITKDMMMTTKISVRDYMFLVRNGCQGSLWFGVFLELGLGLYEKEVQIVLCIIIIIIMSCMLYVL